MLITFQNRKLIFQIFKNKQLCFYRKYAKINGYILTQKLLKLPIYTVLNTT